MIQTRDIFLAAWLKSLPFEYQVEIEKTELGIRFCIVGEQVTENEALYREGWAVTPIVDLKQAFYELLKQSGQAILSIT